MRVPVPHPHPQQGFQPTTWGGLTAPYPALARLLLFPQAFLDVSTDPTLEYTSALGPRQTPKPGALKLRARRGEASREQEHLAGTTQSSTCQGPVERPRQILGLSRGAGAAVGTLVLRPRTDPRVRGGHDRVRTGQELILTKNMQCAGCLLEAWPPMPAPPPPGPSLTLESLTSAGGGRSVDVRWMEAGREACVGIHTRQQWERLCFFQLRQLPRALCLFLPLTLFYRLLKQVIVAGSPRGPRALDTPGPASGQILPTVSAPSFFKQHG